MTIDSFMHDSKVEKERNEILLQQFNKLKQLKS